jgi:DNA (cytosine-5)-methyltransferase 1
MTPRENEMSFRERWQEAHSTASHGRVVAADLFCEIERIVGEVQPRAIILENVLARSYPIECQAFLLHGCPAGLGAAHHRERQWLVAYADDQEQSEFALDDEVARHRAFQCFEEELKHA